MRKLLLVLSLTLFCVGSFAQTSTLQQKLYYTCKVWGFVKYYHSNVSTCGVNWDSVLVSVLPAIRNAATDSEFNDALDTMLAAAGPMALSSTYFPDTLPAELKRNRDWTWIDASPILRSDIQIQLDTIRNNFRPHAGCWVELNTHTTPYIGYLVFPFDSLEIDLHSTALISSVNLKLLMLFKYWNIIRYFNPYNYVLDVSWDSTLYNFVVPIVNAGNSRTLYLLYRKIAAALNDAHVDLYTYSNFLFRPPGFYTPNILVQYIENKYIVVKSLEAGVNVGDVIISIDGLTTAQWEDSLKPYISAGNIPDLRRTVAEYLFSRNNWGQSETLVVQDSTGTNHNYTLTCKAPLDYYAFYATYHYPCDTLDSVKWTTLNCDIGYVNMAQLQIPDVNTMYSDLYEKKAIIFDLRNAPNQTEQYIANLIYPAPATFAKYTAPDVTYPGTFSWVYESQGVSSPANPYSGKVIILMNESTQSESEWSCMMLGAMPGAIKIGSQTAGADGTVTYWQLCQDEFTGFTSLGMFYPNGDSTQRIGIVPDSVVSPSILGIRRHNDEILNAALSIACSASSVHTPAQMATSVSVYPNPANDIITISATGIDANDVAITITDVTCRTLIGITIHKSIPELYAPLNIGNLSSGLYFVNVNTGTNNIVRKFVKE